MILTIGDEYTVYIANGGFDAETVTGILLKYEIHERTEITLWLGLNERAIVERCVLESEKNIACHRVPEIEEMVTHRNETVRKFGLLRKDYPFKWRLKRWWGNLFAAISCPPNSILFLSMALGGLIVQKVSGIEDGFLIGAIAMIGIWGGSWLVRSILVISNGKAE